MLELWSFFSCQIQWTQPSFSWYNRLSAISVAYFTVCECLIIGGVLVLIAYSS